MLVTFDGPEILFVWEKDECTLDSDEDDDGVDEVDKLAEVGVDIERVRARSRVSSDVESVRDCVVELAFLSTPSNLSAFALNSEDFESSKSSATVSVALSDRSEDLLTRAGKLITVVPVLEFE